MKGRLQERVIRLGAKAIGVALTCRYMFVGVKLGISISSTEMELNLSVRIIWFCEKITHRVGDSGFRDGRP